MRVVAIMTTMFCFAAIALSQSDDFSPERFSESWRWVRFGIESGLPSPLVTDVYETSRGDIWAACPTTVAWFDGYRWFSTDSSVGLPAKTEITIEGEINGALLVYEARSGIYLWSGSQFHRLLLPATQMIPVHDSLIFVDGEELFFADYPKLNRHPYHTEFAWKKSLKKWATRSPAICIEFADGLYRIEGSASTMLIPSGTRALDVNLLSENIGGSGLAIVRLPIERAGVWEWAHGVKPGRSTQKIAVAATAIDVAPNGDAVIVHTGGIISYRHSNIWQQVSFNHGLISEITFAKFRNNGDLWVGTKSGLYLWRGSLKRWRSLESPTPSLRNETNELFRARNGELWVGTGDGVNIYTPQWRVRNIAAVNGKALGGVTGINQDQSGNIWISSGGSFPGAFRWDGRAWKYFAVGTENEPVHFHKIRRDRSGQLWFLGLGHNDLHMNTHEPGLYILTVDQKIVPWAPSEGLPNKRIYSFLEDSSGAYWVGHGGGLSRWQHGEWIHPIGNDIHTPFTVAGRLGTPIFVGSRVGHEQTDELLLSLAWLGADGKSIIRKNATGWPTGNVQDIAEDAGDTLWISTNTGVHMSAGEYFLHLGRESGLPTSSVFTTLPEKEEIAIGTDGRGVQVIRRDELLSPPPILEIDPPFVEDNGVLLRWHPYAYWGEPAPQEILTRVQIDGSWTQWSAIHSLELRAQSPGEHHYAIQVQNIFGGFSRAGIERTFNVPAPLFRRPVFYVPIAATSSMMAWLLIVLVIRRRKYLHELKEREEQFSSATNTTPSAIFIVDTDRIVYANPGASVLTGYIAGDLAEFLFSDLISHEYISRLEEIVFHARESSTETRRADIKLQTKAGQPCWVDLTVGVIHLQGKEALLFNAFDITERINATGQLIRKQEQLRMITHELVTTEERERKRMATFLHDIIGQSLAFSKIKLGLMEHGTADDSLKSQIGEVRTLLDSSLQNTRALTFELSPPGLSEFGLVESIRMMGVEMFERERIAFSFSGDGVRFPVNSEMKVVVYYAVREVFNNVLKHAQARNASLNITVAGNVAIIRIADDGVGLGNENSASGRSTFGLYNIRERLGNLGAGMELHSNPEGGTTVIITLPIDASTTYDPEGLS